VRANEITREKENKMLIPELSPKGSDVAGTLNNATYLANDHALYAQRTLEEGGFADEWQVVVAHDRLLMLDYDNRASTRRRIDFDVPSQFYDVLGILNATLGEEARYEVSRSKGGNIHVLVRLNRDMPILERVAWQAAFGSDPKREALHLLSISRDELNPILLFMRKPA
jgi:hypothetical protein